jgi:hypothetical protein
MANDYNSNYFLGYKKLTRLDKVHKTFYHTINSNTGRHLMY